MAEQKYYRHLKEFAQAEAILCDMDYERVILGDRPDIIIETKDGKKIGLEMTECHALTILSNGKISLERANARANDICKKYKEILEIKGVNGFSIYIDFSDKLYEILSRQRYDGKILQEVLDAVEMHREKSVAKSKGNEFYTQWLRDHLHYHTLHEYVDAVTLYENKEFLEVLQTASILSKTVESECLDKCVTAKSEKLKDYKIINPDIDEYWLGIYFTDTSARYFDHLEGYVCCRTKYSRVYLLEHKRKMQVK